MTLERAYQPTRSWHLWLGTLLLLLWLIGADGIAAQISPGPLSAPHSALEGSDHCLQCHSQKKRIAAERCLACHDLLREQLASSRGYHVTVAHTPCERCHMEHHGVDFELVFWGDGGQASFDHSQTDYELRGAHTRIECRACHRAERIEDPSRLLAAGKSLDHTFLGLDASECRNCHHDEHRGQFAPRSCEDCHGMDRWQPMASFPHDDTRFPLVGKHQTVVCDRCHTRGDDPDASATTPSFVRYVGLQFSACSDCHEDPHRGRLGSRCQQCHSEQGWGVTDRQSFDHGRTRFALVGAHRRVRCEVCHPNGISQSLLRFQECSDCHADHHLGQFERRTRGSECDACHDLESFRPAQFTLATHQKSGYPLEGAHRAVPCDACHTPLSAREIQALVRATGRRAGQAGGLSVHRYGFPDKECTGCHTNPHEESLRRFMQVEGCRSCHQLAGWRQIQFDHQRTDYSLQGGHLKPACRDCHPPPSSQHPSGALVFKGQTKDCEACHADPHGGQFANRSSDEGCRGCHGVISWTSLGFHHNRDSDFLLDGSHEQVPCRSCHPLEQIGGRLTARYRPLASSCADCHASQIREGRDRVPR